MKRYFAAAVLNKLEEPWHKPNKSGELPQETENGDNDLYCN